VAVVDSEVLVSDGFVFVFDFLLCISDSDPDCFFAVFLPPIAEAGRLEGVLFFFDEGGVIPLSSMLCCSCCGVLSALCFALGFKLPA